MASSEETPFTLHVSDEALSELNQKLALTRLPDELEDSGWDYGVPLPHIRRLVDRWQSGFSWRAVESEINKLPMFTRSLEVDGFGELNLHYVHKRSTRQNAIPLLFVHGWPGSFLEVEKILPLLTAPTDESAPAFHVVAPSLPGYGFSEAPHKRGFHHVQMAEICHKLMIALGYEEYVTQGGDVGRRVTQVLATVYAPAHVKAWHTNMGHPAEPPRFLQNPLSYLSYMLTPYTDEEKAGFARMKWFQGTQMGYYMMHATKPQTLAYSLDDSPVGLLAWIYEKLVHWTDEYPWEDDEVLRWITVYWFSRAGPGASTRSYFERRAAEAHYRAMPKPVAPLGISYFPKEVLPVPRSWCRTIGNLVYEGTHERGGHFAAHEVPEELVKDVRAMFGRGGPAYGVVQGADGY
ncbi:alpha/beta-hydrolase [Peniophora sp. CONT]|nr:alpha/beta-hydrolase [Peniophora sp. CONT]